MSGRVFILILNHKDLPHKPLAKPQLFPGLRLNYRYNINSSTPDKTKKSPKKFQFCRFFSCWTILKYQTEHLIAFLNYLITLWVYSNLHIYLIHIAWGLTSWSEFCRLVSWPEGEEGQLGLMAGQVQRHRVTLTKKSESYALKLEILRYKTFRKNISSFSKFQPLLLNLVVYTTFK